MSSTMVSRLPRLKAASLSAIVTLGVLVAGCAGSPNRAEVAVAGPPLQLTAPATPEATPPSSQKLLEQSRALIRNASETRAPADTGTSADVMFAATQSRSAAPAAAVGAQLPASAVIRAPSETGLRRQELTGE